MNFVINFLLFFMMTNLQAQVTLRFKSATVAEAEHLGQLLVITPDTHKWSSLSLETKPRVKTLLTKKQVVHWLESKVGPFDYKWEGKQTMLIEAPAHSLGSELLAKAQNALSQKLELNHYTRYELTPITKPSDSTFLLSQLKPQVLDRYPPLKKTCVHLSDGIHSIPIWFKIKAYKKVLVAQKNLKTRTFLKQSDFILKTRNIAGLKGEPYEHIPKRTWLTQSITTDTILTKEHLSLKPSVIKGQHVKVIIQNQGISIVTHATAQHDAQVGQELKLLNETSHQIFFAKLSAPNLAEVNS